VTVPVTSPTFAIAHRYPAAGGLAVSHIDAYRLAGLDGEDPDLLADYLGADRIVFVEWPPEGARELGPPRLVVMLSHGGGERRLIEVVRP
jgi:tRNA threonylcarbamoyladenosine biosynthesis protein TsaE